MIECVYDVWKLGALCSYAFVSEQQMDLVENRPQDETFSSLGKIKKKPTGLNKQHVQVPGGSFLTFSRQLRLICSLCTQNTPAQTVFYANRGNS